jgi:hypothetical protein
MYGVAGRARHTVKRDRWNTMVDAKKGVPCGAFPCQLTPKTTHPETTVKGRQVL